MFDILSWLPWIVTGGTLMWIVLALLAPSVLQIITPFVGHIINGAAEYLRTVWEGFRYMFDKSSAVVFVLSAVAIAYLAGGNVATTKISEVRKHERSETHHQKTSPTKTIKNFFTAKPSKRSGKQEETEAVWGWAK